MVGSNSIFLIAFTLINFISISIAFDTSPLQDFCVATAQGGGCKDPSTVTANDFFQSGLHLAGNTSNQNGASVKAVSAGTMPGLNSLGLTFLRIDFAPGGFLQPHYHPRATELVTVLEGSIEVGFITSFPQYKYYSKVLNSGDVFVVPAGLVHNLRNPAKWKGVAMAALNSQNPGITNLPNAVFAANPAVDAGYLAGAFQLDVNTVKTLQKKF